MPLGQGFRKVVCWLAGLWFWGKWTKQTWLKSVWKSQFLAFLTCLLLFCKSLLAIPPPYLQPPRKRTRMPTPILRLKCTPHWLAINKSVRVDGINGIVRVDRAAGRVTLSCVRIPFFLSFSPTRSHDSK